MSDLPRHIHDKQPPLARQSARREQVAEASDVLQFAANAGDPLRPQDVVLQPNLAAAPPFCPKHEARIFLQPVQQNDNGDVLLMCFADGYEAVYRVATGRYEPRPGRDPATWRPPVLHHESIPRRSRGLERAGQVREAKAAQRRASRQAAAAEGISLKDYYQRLADAAAEPVDPNRKPKRAVAASAPKPTPKVKPAPITVKARGKAKAIKVKPGKPPVYGKMADPRTRRAS